MLNISITSITIDEILSAKLCIFGYNVTNKIT